MENRYAMARHGHAWHTHIVRDRCTMRSFRVPGGNVLQNCLMFRLDWRFHGLQWAFNGLQSGFSSLFMFIPDFQWIQWIRCTGLKKWDKKMSLKGKTTRHSALSLFRHAKLLRNSKKCKGLELNMILITYIYIYIYTYIHRLYICIIHIHYTYITKASREAG